MHSTAPDTSVMPRFLCSSETLRKGETAFSFNVAKDGRIWPAFIIRFEGKVLAYLNVCAHAALRLDGGRGQFFSRDGKSLVCVSHGAVYQPDTGLCISGPCRGLSLIPLRIAEIDGDIYYDDCDYEYCEYEYHA